MRGVHFVYLPFLGCPILNPKPCTLRELVRFRWRGQLEKEKCPPGKYYPFVSGKIKVVSPSPCVRVRMFIHVCSV